MKIVFIAFILLFSLTKCFGQGCVDKYDSVTNRKIYIMVDKMPAYKGGLGELTNVIKRNLQSPGRMCCIEGAVFVSFIIEPTGQMTNKKIVKGISSQNNCNADTEAIKVLDFLTGWTSGECDNIKVPVEISLPVRFSM